MFSLLSVLLFVGVNAFPTMEVTTNITAYNHNLNNARNANLDKKERNWLVLDVIETCLLFFKPSSSMPCKKQNTNLKSILKQDSTPSKKRVQWCDVVVDTFVNADFLLIQKQIRKFERFGTRMKEIKFRNNLSLENRHTMYILVDAATLHWIGSRDSCAPYKSINTVGGKRICGQAFHANHSFSKIFETSVEKCFNLMMQDRKNDDKKWTNEFLNMRTLLVMWNQTNT